MHACEHVAHTYITTIIIIITTTTTIIIIITTPSTITITTYYYHYDYNYDYDDAADLHRANDINNKLIDITNNYYIKDKYINKYICIYIYIYIYIQAPARGAANRLGDLENAGDHVSKYNIGEQV